MVATWLFFVSHRMQRKDDDAGTTAYFCNLFQFASNGNVSTQDLNCKNRRYLKKRGGQMKSLQSLFPNSSASAPRYCVPATQARRSALAFCTKWNYCCGLDMEALSTVLHCWLRPCPRQDHLQLDVQRCELAIEADKERKA